MGDVNFLNLEYLLLRTYQFISDGFALPLWEHMPEWFFTLLTLVVILGLAAALLILCFVVYSNIRLVQVEYEGFRAKEEQLVSATTDEEPEQAQGNARWERIKELAASSAPGDWRRAILEADIMLAAVLESQGYEGATVGDQLKIANPIQMTTLTYAWRAHKVRNNIAHQGESYPLSELEVQTTINDYSRVFEEFGVI